MEGKSDAAKKTTRRNLLLGAVASGTALSLPSAITLGNAGTVFASTGAFAEGWGESLPTGKQYQITSGDASALITEEGAGLRVFSVAGQEFLDTYAADQPDDSSRGQTLIPFPNRIDMGQYVFNGVTEQLPLNDGSNNNAIHGLTRWMNWDLQRYEHDSVTLSIVLHAQDGYPFVLSVQQTYRVSPGTLRVTTTATNIGATALPYGLGHHPYLTLSASNDVINSDILHIPANSYFKTNSRLIPVLPPVPVTGTQYDFRTPHAIGTTVMDVGFADLIPDNDGYVRVKFSSPAGKPSITVFADAAHKYLQVYTGDTLAVSARRHGLAVEPYTCAANAFNNGLGLVVLNPGQSHTASWGISVSL